MQTQVQVAANVLLIEEDTRAADMFCRSLLHEGFGVRAVTSRDAALAVLDLYPCDVIIMDLFQPGMGPEDFIDEVHRRSPRAGIILVTAFQNIAERARALGIRYCFSRPFNVEQMLDALHSFA